MTVAAASRTGSMSYLPDMPSREPTWLTNAEATSGESAAAAAAAASANRRMPSIQ